MRESSMRFFQQSITVGSKTNNDMADYFAKHNTANFSM